MGRFCRWCNSLTFRLTGTLILALVLLFAIAAAVQVSLQERYARKTAAIDGLALTEGLYGALHGAMLANDRDQLRESVGRIAEHSPNLRIRIMNKEGRIVFSSKTTEVGQVLDRDSEACSKCHAAGQPIVALPPGERTRSFTLDGHPALGIIKPIRNDPSCSEAACHAHPASKRLLGVLDTTVVLTPAEQARREASWLILIASAVALLLIIAIVLTVVRQAVDRPVAGLTRTLDAIGAGDYTARYAESHIVEFSHLGEALNRTAHELERANAELLEWTKTLERRVEEKTAALKQAQQRMLQAERLAALGKLAAVVAHEINNPLASVLTYSRLLTRRLAQRPELLAAEKESVQILDAISSEAKRCGDIVSSLLSFARGSSAKREPVDVNDVVQRALFLVKNKADMVGVTVETVLADGLPCAFLSGNQLQQALMALSVNAIDAMPKGGTLRLVTALNSAQQLQIDVGDTGAGMSAEVQARIFEPFFTTKEGEETKGLGLGLTVVDSIVQENRGVISVSSVVGQGTTFSLCFPPHEADPTAAPPSRATAAAVSNATATATGTSTAAAVSNATRKHARHSSRRKA